MSDDQSALFTRLEEATKGLLFQSEADYPIEPFQLDEKSNGPISPQQFLQRVKLPANAPVKELKLGRFFEPATREQEWHNADERETVRRFRDLMKLLEENLTDIRVFKVGKVDSEVYVVGRTPAGSLAGVKTRIVET